MGDLLELVIWKKFGNELGGSVLRQLGLFNGPPEFGKGLIVHQSPPVVTKPQPQEVSVLL